MLDLAKSKINFAKSLTFFYLHVLKEKPACRFESFRFDSLKCIVCFIKPQNLPQIIHSLTQKKKKVLYKPQLSKTQLLRLGRRVTQKGLRKERNFEEVIT